jgi:MFS family permease
MEVVVSHGSPFILKGSCSMLTPPSFYFNLPIGSVTILAILFFFKSTTSKQALRDRGFSGFFRRILQIDMIGSFLALAAFVMLFLGLEYNSRQYPWSSPLVVGLLCGFAVTLLIFIAWQWYRQERALIVPSIFMRRTVAGSCIMAFFIYAVMLIHGYYLPFWLQAIRGESTVGSGVDMLPFVIPNAVFSLLTGIFVTKTGYFTPPAIIGCAIATAASGLISTLQPTTSTAQYVGYVFLVAAGVGMAIQQGFTAVQTVLHLDQIPIATAAVTCFQSLGGAIFVSVGNSILSNELRQAAASPDKNGLRGIDIEAVIAAGATQFRSTVNPDALPALIAVYNAALQKVFVAAIPLAGLAFVSTLLLEWKSVKKSTPEPAISAEEGTTTAVAATATATTATTTNPEPADEKETRPSPPLVQDKTVLVSNDNIGQQQQQQQQRE